MTKTQLKRYKMPQPHTNNFRLYQNKKLKQRETHTGH